MTASSCATVCAAKLICRLRILKVRRPKTAISRISHIVLNVLADPRPQDVEPGYLRVFLKTAGADSPRPMKLRQKASTGEWFLWEYSSILSGIRIPAAEDPWA